MNLGGRIVVLGGYGNFGARVARALVSDGRAEVIIAGRDFNRADRLVAELTHAHPGACVRAIELDRDDPQFVRKLGSAAPIVVVHAAGPFQGQDYAVAEACIACRSHYVDLADGRRFVCDFDVLDREARRRDVLLVTGASTLPALSSAVVDLLSADMAQIDSIRTVILPAGRSLPGAATFGAVMEYCGKPVRTFENGSWVSRTGWEDARRLLIDEKARNVAVCDVPDLELFPKHYDHLRTATFHAGPEWAWQHRFIRVMARLVRRGWIESWSPYARSLQRLNALMSVTGSATGYMQVEVQGEDNARRAILRKWNLIAGQNHGPEIPCMPARILAKKLIAGETRARGARPCLGLMDLDDFAREVATLDISWSVEEGSSC